MDLKTGRSGWEQNSGSAFCPLASHLSTRWSNVPKNGHGKLRKLLKMFLFILYENQGESPKKWRAPLGWSSLVTSIFFRIAPHRLRKFQLGRAVFFIGVPWRGLRRLSRYTFVSDGFLLHVWWILRDSQSDIFVYSTHPYSIMYVYFCNIYTHAEMNLVKL